MLRKLFEVRRTAVTEDLRPSSSCSKNDNTKAGWKLLMYFLGLNNGISALRFAIFDLTI